MKSKESSKISELLGRTDPPPMNPFTARKIRTRIVEAARRGPSRPALPRARRVTTWAAAAFFALATLVLVWWFASQPVRDHLVIVASPDATWSRERGGGVDRVRATSGHFEFEVRDHMAGERVIVEVPDGEIEDVGTRFAITVAGGHTLDVSVFEGAVEWRRAGSDPVRLEAGAHWTAPSTAPPTAPASAPPSASVLPSAGAPSEAAVATTASAVAPQSSAARSQLPHSSGPPPLEGADEDAAYLRVVALLREHRDEEAKLAAREYLRKFPRGLRRVEVGKIAE